MTSLGRHNGWNSWVWALVGCAVVGLSLAWYASQSPSYFAVHTVDADARNLALADQLGVDTIVQLFSWREIEPTQGEFHWQFADEVVRGAEYYGLNVVLRIDQQPGWASKASLNVNSPPDNLTDYVQFVRRVAERYRKRVFGYVIWNEPNLAREWGGHTPDAAGYVAMLREAYSAIKEADPGALVVSAGLAPTNDQSPEALDDRLFLQAMYAAGAAPYFDVLGAHPYGFAYPPDDPRGAHDGLNLARIMDLRDIMIRNGDRGKPIWATELGWTTEATGAALWQQVSPAQQAAYLTGAFKRARREWPWLKLIAVWNLGGEDRPEWRGYSLLETGGEPKPAFSAMGRLSRSLSTPRLGHIVQRLRTWLGQHLLATHFRYQVLAEDSVIHLGDSDFSQPWMPLFRNRNPSTVWEGTAWVEDPGAQPWQLALRVMQSNVRDNYVWVNGYRLEPPFPAEDFSGAWVSQTWTVPSGLLRRGPNLVRVTIGRTLPLVQADRFAWDDLQIKDIVLWH